MKTTLQTAKELLESVGVEGVGVESDNRKIEKAKGLALVWLAAQTGRVATQLETLNEKISKHKQHK